MQIARYILCDQIPDVTESRGKKESTGIKTGIKSDARIKSSCYLSSVITNFITVSVQ